MKWTWLQWLGVAGAGFVGAVIFTIIARASGDLSLLVNSDVIGAAIGASLTIVGTLTIEAGRRQTLIVHRMNQIRKTLGALDAISGMALEEVDVGLPLADRAAATATLLGGLGGGREVLSFARTRADIGDVRLWLKFETLDRCFDRFDAEREADKLALVEPNVTEAEWAEAHERLRTFSASIRERIHGLTEALEAQ